MAVGPRANMRLSAHGAATERTARPSSGTNRQGLLCKLFELGLSSPQAQGCGPIFGRLQVMGQKQKRVGLPIVAYDQLPDLKLMALLLARNRRLGRQLTGVGKPNDAGQELLHTQGQLQQLLFLQPQTRVPPLGGD